jgi:transposase-like protein
MGKRGYPPEFRRPVLDLVEAGRKMAEVAVDLGINDRTIYNWRRQDRVNRGLEPGLTTAEQAKLVAAREGVALAEALHLERLPSREHLHRRSRPRSPTWSSTTPASTTRTFSEVEHCRTPVPTAQRRVGGELAPAARRSAWRDAPADLDGPTLGVLHDEITYRILGVGVGHSVIAEVRELALGPFVGFGAPPILPEIVAKQHRVPLVGAPSLSDVEVRRRLARAPESLHPVSTRYGFRRDVVLADSAPTERPDLLRPAVRRGQ